MKKNLNYFIVVFFIGLAYCIAQPTLPGQGTDGGNVTDTPIHFLIYPFLILGTYLGFRYTKKN